MNQRKCEVPACMANSDKICNSEPPLSGILE